MTPSNPLASPDTRQVYEYLSTVPGVLSGQNLPPWAFDTPVEHANYLPSPCPGAAGLRPGD